MATSQADIAHRSAPSSTGVRSWLAFAKPRQFAWKTLLLAALTIGLGAVVWSKHALAAQIYLGLLIAVHIVGLAVIALRVERRDLAPSRFGLFWRGVAIAALVALLMSIRVDPDSMFFWPALGSIFVLHTAGLSLLHLRAREGAGCPFLPRSWSRAAPKP